MYVYAFDALVSNDKDDDMKCILHEFSVFLCCLPLVLGAKQEISTKSTINNVLGEQQIQALNKQTVIFIVLYV